MQIPKLQPTTRRREYDSYSDELRSQVVREWLFSEKTHRDIDEEILGLNRNISKGYQSMNILHFLGLKADFHGLFKGISEEVAIVFLKDDDQDFRDVISLLEERKEIINLQTLVDQESEEIRRAKEDTSEKRRERISRAEKRPKRIRVYSYTYHRNPDIVAEALSRANGYCETCGSSAPFVRASDGSPFLEVHHVKSLSDGGEDTLVNVLALCPNCHRKKHYG
jgi:5-methylcytosine-specific restriction protein A